MIYVAIAVLLLIALGAWGSTLPNTPWAEEMFQTQPEPYDPQGEPGNWLGPKSGTVGTVQRGV